MHIEDIARAFLAVLEAPRDEVHLQAFNVGATDENYRIRDVAQMVEEVVPGARIRFAEGAGPDLRCYRVNCDRLARSFPAARPRWTARQGIEQLHDAFRRHGVQAAEFEGPRFHRKAHVLAQMAAGRLGRDLRWAAPQGAATRAA